MNVNLWLEESEAGDSFGRSVLLVLPSASSGTSLSVYLLMRRLLNGCWKETKWEICGKRVSLVKVGLKVGQFPQMEKPAAQMPWLVSMPPIQRTEKCEFILPHRSSEDCLETIFGWDELAKE